MNELGRNKKELVDKLRGGDVEAYHQLQILYLDYKPEDIIPYARYMADTINYAPANLDVFEAYVNKYLFDETSVLLDSMEQVDRQMALSYLKESRKLRVDGVSKYDYIEIPK